MGENFDQMEESLKQFEGKHSNFTHSIEDELGTLRNYFHNLRKIKIYWFYFSKQCQYSVTAYRLDQ